MKKKNLDAPKNFKIDKKSKTIQLSGFNNLTKSLGFNIYDISYTPSTESQKEYIEYIDDLYGAEKLNGLLHEVIKIIDAHPISYSMQDYTPAGASATILISEELVGSSDVVHLDKSHVAAHTYPETNPLTGISTFRVDIEVSTCGKVSPLRALDFMMSNFEADIVNIDYRVRGFTRDVSGKKHYIDHEIYDVSDFISPKITNNYNCLSRNLHEENLYHLKMMLNSPEITPYLFSKEMRMKKEEREKVMSLIQKEMQEIFMRSDL